MGGGGGKYHEDPWNRKSCRVGSQTKKKPPWKGNGNFLEPHNARQKSSMPDKVKHNNALGTKELELLEMKVSMKIKHLFERFLGIVQTLFTLCKFSRPLLCVAN